jgi:hypothetical protein
MANMSPLVRDSLEKESYRLTADSDGATEDYILADSFKLFIQEMDSLGLSLSLDTTSVIDDRSQLFPFLHLASYLMPASLYHQLKTQQHLRQVLGDLLTGSLGDANASLIHNYLSELGGLDDQMALVPDLTDQADQLYLHITQSDVYTDYMTNLMVLVDEEKLALESDADSHAQYRDKLKVIIGRLTDAVNNFSRDPAFDELGQIQRFIIQDFINPSNFIAYNYLFTLSPDLLPDELIASWKQKQMGYQASHPWCSLYYTVRDLKPTSVQIIMLHCFLYALHGDRADYATVASELGKTYPLSFDLTSSLFKDLVS